MSTSVFDDADIVVNGLDQSCCLAEERRTGVAFAWWVVDAVSIFVDDRGETIDGSQGEAGWAFYRKTARMRHCPMADSVFGETNDAASLAV